MPVSTNRKSWQRKMVADIMETRISRGERAEGGTWRKRKKFSLSTNRCTGNRRIVVIHLNVICFIFVSLTIFFRLMCLPRKSFRIVFLRFIGCWSYNRQQNTRENIYTLAACASLVNSFVGVFLSFYALLLFIADQKTIQLICNQAVTFIIAFQVFTKSGLMFLKSHKLQKLINDLNGSLYQNFVSTEKDREIIRKCYVYDLRLSIFFCVFSTFVTVANILKPVIVTLSSRDTQLNEHGEIIGEFPSKYPFQLPANSFWYGFWFGQQVMVVLPGGIASWISDSMLCAFLYYICGHFEIVKNKIREGGNELDLRKIVQHHRLLMRFSKETIITFGPLIVIQLLLAAITICCLLFQFFSVSGELVQYFRPLTYLILKLIQIYILCWHGQLLLDESSQIGEELYFCPWYDKTKNITSDLKTLMVFSRVPVKVSYGAIFHLSAGTFMQILNAAYGYFAMMSKMKQ